MVGYAISRADLVIVPDAGEPARRDRSGERHPPGAQPGEGERQNHPDRARGRIGLPPAAAPIETTATEQKNDDYDDKKRGRVHGFSVLSKAFPRHPGSRSLYLTLTAAFCCRLPQPSGLINIASIERTEPRSPA
jgi:hypothetical protein